MGGVVEAHQPGGVLGGEADLGPEAGPQALAAPSHLVRQAVDAHPSPAGEHQPPGSSHLWIKRRAGAHSSAKGVHCDREPLVPRRGGPQPFLGSPGVAAPDILQGDHRPAEVGRCAEHRNRQDR